MSETVIEARGLRAAYGSRDVLSGIDLSVHEGQVFALLGPNGAGKTTTVEILEGYRRRSDGELSVLGVDPEAGGSRWREQIGVVLQSSETEPELTVKETIDFYGALYPNPRSTAEVLAMVGLERHARGFAKRMSGGERRRLDVALALVGRPQLLFLDEPTTGFDPEARVAAWEMLSNLTEHGTTVFLTTHYLDEAEALADTVAVLVDGEIVASGPVDTLGERHASPATITFVLPAATDVARLPPELMATAVSAGARVRISALEPLPVLSSLAEWSEATPVPISDLEVRRETLQDVYLRLIRERR